MAGNARFESPSASSSEPVFSGAYSNGKRGTHSMAVGPNLDRSGSFREGAESRLFGSGIAVSRGGSSAVAVSGNLPPLSQCLSLEPIVMGDQKINRSGELRRVMGLFVGSTTKDNSSGAAGPTHLKASPPVAVAEDLKRFRSSVVDTCNTARGRASKLDEHLHKLDKYCDGVISKKPQRNELTSSDLVGALNSKIVNQRIEDRPKNVLMNKRVRTSVAETRAEFRSNGLRRQPVVMAKDRELHKDNGGESDMFEEKIRRLPAGGEGWDKKMKRKRSVGTVFTRPIDSNGEPKRTVQNKVVSEPGMQSNDAHPHRLGASNGINSTYKLDNKPDNKLEGASLPNSSRARLSPRNELEGPGLARDLTAGPNKERILAKGSTKLNSRDDNYATCGSPVMKGKASRALRTSAIGAASSSPNTPRVSGTLENWENATGASKITSTGGASNRKRAMPSGSSSPNMAQWVGQRPQKMSRTRRANLVSPVSNQEEKQLSSDSCSPSDISVRLASDGTNGSLISKYATCGPQQFKVKLDNVQSPHRLSESEESVGGESRVKEKGKGNSDADANDGQNGGPPLALGMKNKPRTNEESGEGVRRQGRIGRGPLIARACSSPTGEKSDNGATLKPLRSNKPGYEKNGSKLGRPLKRLSDRKGFSRLGHLQIGGSDCTGKSDDDREELLAAANHARNANHLACSSAFWKKMELIFAPVSSKDKFYLSLQLNSEQEIQESFLQLHGRENTVAVDVLHEGASVYDTHASGERNGHVKHQGSESFSGTLDSDRTSREFIPLYQRVLSALIIEDNIDELEEDEDAGNTQLQDPFFDSAYDTFHLNDYEPRKRARRESEHDAMFGVHAQSIHTMKNSFSSNRCHNSFRSPSVNNSPCEDVHSEVELLAGISKKFLNGPQVLHSEGFGISSFGSQYEQMHLDDKLLLELQSIGLYMESVPNLDDKEDEAIKHEIDQLKIRLQQQNGKKKAYLEKIRKGVGSSSVGRDLEQVAIDRLVELAYRKLLATRGSSKAGIPKVPKQVALAFGRRTLARCRKFGKSGTSCFNVPPLRDILFAPRENESEPTASVGCLVADTRYLGYQNPKQDSRLSSSGMYARSVDGGSPNVFRNFNHVSDEAFAINGPISNRGKKKELLLDDVGTMLGGTMGKRSERDVAKGGRMSQGERKTKPRQKAAQPPTPTNGFVNQYTRPIHPVQPSANGMADNGGDKKKDVRFVSQGNGPQETPKEIDSTSLLLSDLDPMDELGVGGPQDLSSLLNFDEEDLQDHYSAGLDIPMDDLSELNMF